MDVMSLFSSFRSEVTRSEMASHLSARVAYHAGKVAKFETVLGALKEDGEQALKDHPELLKAAQGMIGHGYALIGRTIGGNLADQGLQHLSAGLEASLKRHASKAKELDFYLQHLGSATKFDLSYADLTRLEFVVDGANGGFNPLLGQPAGDWIELD